MNAPANIASAESAAQSLLAVCKARRWDLLQQFARLEIALRQKLKPAPQTFGKKVRAWIELQPTAKRFERLIHARNLTAHALVSCVRIDAVTYVHWDIADQTSELKCAKFDKPALKAWADDLDDLLKQAIAAAKA